MTYENQLALWLDRAGEDPDLTAELREVQHDEKAVSDRFYRHLAFGTGGLRGVLGAGTNRMNLYTVRRATQGLADYLNATDLPKSVAIAHDSRVKGDLFAREAARVLAANGITAHLYPRLEPTPALSWAVRYLHCGAGICVTASHNPAQYNGYKVYGADGCQITPEAAEKVLAAMEKTDCFDGVKLADYDAAAAEGKIQIIPDECLDAFVDAVLDLRPGNDVSRLKLVYTPLNGSGLECVKKLLAKMGVTELTVVPSQEAPDGRFPTCPYPNPEIREAMEEGLRLCGEVKPDLLIGTDPDCDRMGAAVPDGRGGYRLITGNEMGVLLLDYLCRTGIARGTMPEDPVAVTTIVSTDMAAPVAAASIKTPSSGVSLQLQPPTDSSALAPFWWAALISVRAVSGFSRGRRPSSAVGMAKPMPSNSELFILAELMPITCPNRLTSAPPELPGLMAALVWISTMVMPSTSTDRHSAETMPSVKVAR